MVLVLTVTQIPFWVYLIWVSFTKLKEMYALSVIESHAAIRRRDVLSTNSLKARQGQLVSSTALSFCCASWDSV